MDIENPMIFGKNNDHYNKVNSFLGNCESCKREIYEHELYYKDIDDEYYCDFICYGDVAVKRGLLFDSEDTD